MSPVTERPGYAAIVGAAALAPPLDAAIVELTGRDPLRMVQGLLTNDVAGAPAARAVYGAMLTPKGRVITDVVVVREAGRTDRLLLRVPAPALEAVMAHLGKYVPPMFARPRVAEELAGVAVYGPAARDVVASALDTAAPVGEDDVVWTEVDGTPVLALGTGDAGPGVELWAPHPVAAALRARIEGAGAVTATVADVEAVRVEAGRPQLPAEIGEAYLPHEIYESAGLLPRAVSFTKGCYTGQEVVVRIAHRGHVNRLLRGLLLPGSAGAVGDSLYVPGGEKVVGHLTTVADSPRLGRVALGYVRREVAPGEEVRVGSGDGAAAVVSGLPFTPRDAA